MLRGFRRVPRRLGRVGVITATLVLSACSSDNSSAVLGTWKDINQERYLTIEKSTEHDVGISAIIYAPTAAEQDNSQLVMNHLSMPASIHNGILMLEVEAGLIPVLYDQANQQVVLNGTDKYQRVPDEVAQLKLASVR